jgi:hypothetical protein
MGLGSYVALINATPYEWNLGGQVSNQMIVWNFPASISPTASALIYVEFNDDNDWRSNADASYNFGVGATFNRFSCSGMR